MQLGDETLTEPTRLDDLATSTRPGGKGAALAWLQHHGYRVPDTWVVPPETAPDLAALADGRRYAVRSSANVEDGATASYAGQFLTVLDVAEPVEVAAAIEAVRASAAGETVDAYSGKVGGTEPIAMSVLVQSMIEPVASGVIFTRNPLTGLNEVIIEAVAGRGDQLVGEGMTPQRWVRRWGDWTTSPAEAVLPDATATALVTEALEIAEAFGQPADLEWVWDGTEVWWVQIRPITGIEDVAVYSNRISKEVMPGLIKPLVWSVNVPVVNRAWIELFTEAVGKNDLQPDDLARSFAYRSYFNMAAIGDIFELLGMPRDSLELLLGLPEGPDKPSFKPSAATMRRTPRLLGFALRKSRYGKDPETVLAGLRATYARFDVPLSERSDSELLQGIDDLMEIGTRAAYANIVVPLLANLYSGLLRKRLAKKGLDHAVVEVGTDAAFHDLDPNPGLDRLAEIVATHGPDSPEAGTALRELIDRFGHFSDSGNDFSVAPWREQPEVVLEMAAARGVTDRDHVRRPWSESTASLGPMSRFSLGLLRKRAARYQLRRDQVSSLYTYGYGLFRPYFLELGSRLAQRGVIGAAPDIMMLTLDQVKAVISGELSADDAGTIVAHHRGELDRVSGLTMPEIIFGDTYIAAASSSPEGTLHGVATSRGHHRGPVKVVTGIADFAKLEPGDVLAIPFSDVGWTPLFAQAGAVVAESGGMLSHSSIVAREYGIPCVVSVAGATRLEDGTIVTVDGYRGEVITD